MHNKIKRLPDAELEIMLIIWNSELPVNSVSILEQLQKQRTWGLPTLMTVLSRLVKKGFLICEKQGRNNLYHVAVGEEEYKQSEGKSLLEKLYGSSFKNLVSSLHKANAISDSDILELRKFLDELEKGE